MVKTKNILINKYLNNKINLYELKRELEKKGYTEIEIKNIIDKEVIGIN